MKGIILAAGRGSRMGGLTEKLPKCRTPFFGKELIDWQLDAFKGAGIKDVSIITGYLKETFQYNTHYFTNERWAETQMVMTLMQAKEWLSSDDCIISYSDICYSPDPVEKLKSTSADLAISYDPDWLALWNVRMENPLDDAETFKLDSESNLTEIGQKTSTLNDIQGQYMGLIKTTPRAFTHIENLIDLIDPALADKLDFTSLLSLLINKGIKIKAVPISDQWYEVDTEQDLIAYQNWKSEKNLFLKNSQST